MSNTFQPHGGGMQPGEPFWRRVEGMARAWVEARAGAWDHAGWLEFLGLVTRAAGAPVDRQTVGRVLERFKAEHHNLRRWREAGGAYRWVEERRGAWSHHDWMTLLAGLQCWLGPLDPAALGRALEEARRQYHAVQRWVASGEPARWVEERAGAWDHADWLALLASLRAAGPFAGLADLPQDAVGRALEEHKAAYRNLRRWESSGEPARWVEAHRGRWTHADWLRLLASLERSEFAPLDPEQVGRVLEEGRRRYHHLRLFQQSGEAWLWVARQRGEWDHAAFLDLLARLDREGLAVDPVALGELLEAGRAEYRSLRARLGLPSRKDEGGRRKEEPEGAAVCLPPSSFLLHPGGRPAVSLFIPDAA